MAYDNTNSGMMAWNENRKTDKHPEFSGSINVEGTDYWLSAWVNEGKPGGKMEGKKYFSIKINRKDGGQSSGGGGGIQRMERPSYGNLESDDIPY
jgi:hypothetical protein